VRYGGLFVVIELALKQLDDPVLSRYRDPFILGSLRVSCEPYVVLLVRRLK